MTLDSLAHSLQARKSGSTWMARCPSHEDRNPSLAIREKDGKLLFFCHAGCTQYEVLDALKSRGIVIAEPSQNRVIVAEYNYTDEAGKLLYQVIRYAPKDFRHRRPDGHGGWAWSMKGQRRVLYHLPEVLEAPIIFVAEGEKDVEILRSHGFVATTWAGGAKAPWLPELTDTLRGRECVLIPDNDKAGWERAAVIARALLHNVARLRVFDLPNGIKDISDWFAAGHSECELIADLEGVDVV